MASEAQMMLELFFAIYFPLIIDRSHQEYYPYDTYSTWERQSPDHRRLIVAWTTLFALPLFHFALTYVVLGENPIDIGPNTYGVLNIVPIGILSIFSFGYYRIFEPVINRFRRSIFTLKVS